MTDWDSDIIIIPFSFHFQGWWHIKNNNNIKMRNVSKLFKYTIFRSRFFRLLCILTNQYHYTCALLHEQLKKKKKSKNWYLVSGFFIYEQYIGCVLLHWHFKENIYVTRCIIRVPCHLPSWKQNIFVVLTWYRKSSSLLPLSPLSSDSLSFTGTS